MFLELSFSYILRKTNQITSRTNISQVESSNKLYFIHKEITIHEINKDMVTLKFNDKTAGHYSDAI